MRTESKEFSAAYNEVQEEEPTIPDQVINFFERITDEEFEKWWAERNQ